MAINKKISDEKLPYDITREVAKAPTLSSGKFGKYKYLTGKEILLFNQSQIIQQAKFSYSPLGKVFQKETKTMEEQGRI